MTISRGTASRRLPNTGGRCPRPSVQGWTVFALTALASWVGTSCGGADGAPVASIPADPDAYVAADSTRVLKELGVLAADSLEGRRTGTRGNRVAREYIAAELQASGAQPAPGGFVEPFEFRNRRDSTQLLEGANVVGFVEGKDPSLGAIVITAHFDHLGIRPPREGTPPEAAHDSIYNGADDNASGTVALLSMARYFAGNQPLHTIVFAAVDAEEMGSVGAQEFVDRGWPEHMVLNVNMDMVSRSDSLLFAAGTSHYPQLRPILESVQARSPVVLRFGHDQRGIEGVDDWTGSSDHRAFHRAGIPFVYFGVEDHADYHRATDEVDKIDPDFYLNAIRTILAEVLAMDHGLGAPQDSMGGGAG